MPHRLALGSCSHTALSQPLWSVVRARRPAAFVWGGDAVYGDRFAGLNWTAVGLRRVDHDAASNATSWRVTFPPPSVHLEATPDVLRERYAEQWAVEDYRRFVEGWRDDAEAGADLISRPVIFGTIDDHDYGQNNGDLTYNHKRESNMAFVDFLYSGVEEEPREREAVAAKEGICNVSQKPHQRHPESTDDTEPNTQSQASCARTRRKVDDPMFRRARKGKGVYGVQLFDFARNRTRSERGCALWGGGYWVEEDAAMIDPDIVRPKTRIHYSLTHSVAVFVLDVRSNKTPWPRGKKQHVAHSGEHDEGASGKKTGSSVRPPLLDFLGRAQWEWFQAALVNSRATVNVIVSGLQIHPERFPSDGNVVEEWSKFPAARQRLYDTVLDSGARSPLLVSGDVHMAQVLRKEVRPEIPHLADSLRVVQRAAHLAFVRFAAPASASARLTSQRRERARARPPLERGRS